MTKLLLIKVINSEIKDLYVNHSTYHEGDSGIDIFTPEEFTILPGEIKMIDLGIQCEVRNYKKELNDDNEYTNLSYYLYPRSSISKTPLMLANGTGIIDSGYRGNLIAAVRYVPTNQDLQRIVEVGSLDCYPPYKVEKGTRLFQLCSNDLSPFDGFALHDTLSNTSRGEGGFGSTGI